MSKSLSNFKKYFDANHKAGSGIYVKNVSLEILRGPKINVTKY